MDIPQSMLRLKGFMTRLTSTWHRYRLSGTSYRHVLAVHSVDASTMPNDEAMTWRTWSSAALRKNSAIPINFPRLRGLYVTLTFPSKKQIGITRCLVRSKDHSVALDVANRFGAGDGCRTFSESSIKLCLQKVCAVPAPLISAVSLR